MITNRPIRLGIGLPAYGGTFAADQFRQWLYLGFELASSSERFELRMSGYRDVCGVDMARCLMMEDAQDAGCDWLLMIDADVWVEDPRSLLVMISEADRNMAAIVVAPVRKRTIGSAASELMIWRKGEPAMCELPRVDDMFPIDRAATACFAINLGDAAVRELDRPFFRFTPHASEDLDFCDRVRANRGLVYCDPRVRTFHRMRAAAQASR